MTINWASNAKNIDISESKFILFRNETHRIVRSIGYFHFEFNPDWIEVIKPVRCTGA